ncbi:hypothetical protein P9112_001950 [Eukaryota sp. TZLM1-RC]
MSYDPALQGILDMLYDELSIVSLHLSDEDKLSLAKGCPSVFHKALQHMFCSFSGLVSRFLRDNGYSVTASNSEREVVDTSITLLVADFNYREIVSVNQILTYPCSTSLIVEKLLFLFIIAKSFKRKHNELVLEAIKNDPKFSESFIQERVAAWKNIKPISRYEQQFRELYRQCLPSPNISSKQPLVDPNEGNIKMLLPEFDMGGQASPLDLCLWMKQLSPKKSQFT